MVRKRRHGMPGEPGAVLLEMQVPVRYEKLERPRRMLPVRPRRPAPGVKLSQGGGRIRISVLRLALYGSVVRKRGQGYVSRDGICRLRRRNGYEGRPAGGIS